MRGPLVAAVLAAATSLGAFAAPASAATHEGQATYLFVVNSKRGTITGVGEDRGTEKLRLTLRGVNNHATQFADRPIRRAYVLSTRDLTARWKRWFADSPPNAVLTFSRRNDPMPHSIVVTLRRPRYHPKADTLVFTARHIHRSPDLSPDAEQPIPLPKRRPPAKFVRGSLFIDSVGQGTWINGCLIGITMSCPGVNLSGQDLSGTSINSSNLSRANLSHANLSGAWVTDSRLVSADLTGANLTRADLAASDLTGANLTGAVLTGARLKWANLTQANLTGADLSGANLYQANFSGATWIDGRTCGWDNNFAYPSGRCL